MKQSSNQQLESFFSKRIFSILEQNKLALNEFLQIYIVGLCLKAVRSENIFMFDSQGEVPLAFSWGKAVSEGSRFKRFKDLVAVGDRSLYVAGFFSDYFNRQLFDIEYYIQMGSLAYEQASDLQHQLNQKNETDIFLLLARHFKDLVFIMSELSEEMNMTNKQDLLSLYQRWIATKNQHLLKKLKEKGVVVFEQEERIIH
ncbi:MAG TPA: hypothetical protein PKC21_03555 [Oligoflexia bacterium]|nr:hypothetical protein [Oligoflexia bacterium]HMR24412.1 hypothetical protein [Oligoflexia bacterium]